MRAILITVVVASFIGSVAFAALGAVSAVNSIDQRQAAVEKTLEEAK